MDRINYYLDGINFLTFGVYVSDSNGILDRPKLKSPTSVNWDDYHGTVVDLENKRLEAREITLNCFVKAEGKLDFVNKLNSFLDIFSRPGTQRLAIVINPEKPLLYEVYNESGVSIKKRWNSDLMVGTFTLKLKEPEPVKRILSYERSDEKTKTLSITLTSNKSVSIYWGDGTKTEDIYGTSVTVSHDYAENGKYFIEIAGVIENITNFSTNGQVVWNKL